MSHKKIAHIDIQYDNNTKVNFRDVAVLPTPVDNCAICTRKIEKNTVIVYPNNIEFALSHTILEGHRFCTQFIPKGSHLTSWGLPFGDALRDIHPGEYVCNASVLEQLNLRHLDFALPSEPNFQDRLDNYQLPDVIPHTPLTPHGEKVTFMGYPRGARGVGTRNYIVILGLTSTCGSYARALLETVKSKYPEKTMKETYKNIDGVVAISHTEGSSQQFNNFDFVMRTLCGWIIHSNVGAVIVAVDPAVNSPLNMQSVINYMKENNYPEHKWGHLEFLPLSDNFKSDVDRGLSVVTSFFDLVNESQREVCDAGNLKIALQCGGSDAFSGISANPLAAWTAKDIIRYGGCANLAETDELMGAEPYVVRNCRSREVAEKFLGTVKWFREWAGWHGHNAEGNPSGGNKFRGLYNIALKSLGAAMKRNPDVPLGHVIDYSELMNSPGYYFMNSPGNDLESIAGQVASGCQIIFFTTGNGSITNFPFVPTIKIVTTTGRFKLLSKDMDFNAGEYLDGVPMETLGKRLTDLTLQVACGQLTCGERAGHSQVSIWRNWTQRDSSHLSELQQTPDLHSGQSLVTIATGSRDSSHRFRGIITKKGVATDSVGLVLPTSLCSGQIARIITENLNEKLKDHKWPVSKFVALPHTEGCGSSGGSGEALYRRTVLGHLVNPVVHTGLLLEHGCEKTHNDYMSEHLKSMGVSTSDFGWASVQLDGGISKVTDKVISWFENKFAQENNTKPSEETVGLEHLRIALLSPYGSHISPSAAKALAAVVRLIIENGGTVVIPSNSTLLKINDFLQELDETCPIVAPVNPTISYGQIPNSKGLHVMSCPSDHWVETLTGLGATGIEIMVGYIEAETEHQKTMQTHPMFPLVQITTEAATSEDFDVKLQVAQVEKWTEQVLELVLKTASREYVPKLKGNSDFQIARDVLQVSM